MSSIVIVGAGECGGRAALELRRLGYTGAIVLVGAEDSPPYERPPLSKQGIVGGEAPRLIASAADYGDANIALRLAEVVTAIDRQQKEVVLGSGGRIAYDKLLLATGARSRALPGLPPSDRVMSLRTHRDAECIRAHLVAGRRLAIIGGGFIGLELAASARKLGVETAVFEGQSRLLTRGVPSDIAEQIMMRHIEEGVRFFFDAAIGAVVDEGDRVLVHYAGDQCLYLDLVVLGIGAVPNAELAAEAGLTIDNGIAVDRHLVTSDPSILAAGDCCSFPAAPYGDRRVRLESWRNAQEHAQIAAANLHGATLAVSTVPWFWSDQYDLTLQVAGLSGGGTRTVRRVLDDKAFIMFELDAADRLLSASGLGVGNAVARDIRLSEMLIAAGRTLDPAALASPEVKLKSLLAS